VSSSLLHGTIDDRITALPKLVFFSVKSNYFSGSGSGSLGAYLLVELADQGVSGLERLPGNRMGAAVPPNGGVLYSRGLAGRHDRKSEVDMLRDVLDSVRAAEDLRSVGEV
jgi:hypothetical protein